MGKFRGIGDGHPNIMSRIQKPMAIIKLACEYQCLWDGHPLLKKTESCLDHGTYVARPRPLAGEFMCKSHVSEHTRESLGIVIPFLWLGD